MVRRIGIELGRVFYRVPFQSKSERERASSTKFRRYGC